MKTEEADQLAKRIINTFRSTPALPEWRDTLDKLDIGQANTAFVRCRAAVDERLSIARYLAEYNSLRTRRPDHVECPACDDTGWITATPEDAAHRYAKPCSCPEGKRAEQIDMARSW
jgi:hypothetical protein